MTKIATADTQQSFDVESALAATRDHRQIARRRRRYRSRLDRHRAELVALRAAGATLAELAAWLRLNRRTKVARSTILRRLRSWPESIDAP